MTLERTSLIFERRGNIRDSTHKALDRIRFLSGVTRKLSRPFSLITREMDTPPTMPSVGMTMASPVGPISVGGIMRHS